MLKPTSHFITSFRPTASEQRITIAALRDLQAKDAQNKGKPELARALAKEAQRLLHDEVPLDQIRTFEEICSDTNHSNRSPRGIALLCG